MIDGGALKEAGALLREVGISDMHVESFLPHRLYGYAIDRDHTAGPPYGILFGHLDLPRMRAVHAWMPTFSITTNVLRRREARRETLSANVEALRTLLRANAVELYDDSGRFTPAGAMPASIGIQGGNAFDGGRNFVLPHASITRVTIAHLTNSSLGGTSAPTAGSQSLTPRGIEFIEWLHAERVFVDLAHANRPTFWAAVEASRSRGPLLVSHTGMNQAHAHWRNIDAEQARAVAATGGVIGIIFHRAFLGTAHDASDVVRHIESAIDACGEDHVGIGSDFDGFIIPPRDLRDGAVAYLRVVAALIARGHSRTRIEKILTKNYLRALRELGRPVPERPTH